MQLQAIKHYKKNQKDPNDYKWSIKKYDFLVQWTKPDSNDIFIVKKDILVPQKYMGELFFILLVNSCEPFDFDPTHLMRSCSRSDYVLRSHVH